MSTKLRQQTDLLLTAGGNGWWFAVGLSNWLAGRLTDRLYEKTEIIEYMMNIISLIHHFYDRCDEQVLWHYISNAYKRIEYIRLGTFSFGLLNFLDHTEYFVPKIQKLTKDSVTFKLQYISKEKFPEPFYLVRSLKNDIFQLQI